MNNGAQGQPAQGQPAGAQPQQKRAMIIYKPEQMRQLPNNFTQGEKEKWEQGLRALYGTMDKHGAETPQHGEAKRKLFEFSKTLNQKLQNFARQNQQAQQAQQGQQGQQGQQAGGAARTGSQGQAMGQEGEQSNTNQSSGQSNRSQIPPKILEHVHNFPYSIPPQMQAGSPEAQKWIAEAKSRYVKGLVTMDSATQRIAQMDTMYAKRNEEGRPLNSEEEKEYREKKEASMKQHSEAKAFVDNFRKQQQQQHARAGGNANQQGNPTQQGGNASNTQTPVRGPMSATQTTNPALNTQSVNAAIEAARVQQMSGGRPQMPQNGQGVPNQNAPTHQNMPQHQGGQVQNIKQESGVPQINTQMQGRPMQNNSPQSAIPQSAQSAGPQSAVSNPQVPRALTHPQALQTAARTYSSGQTSSTPNVMGQGHSHTHPSAPRETQNVITNKMPIPKHLPERATQQPLPIAMPQTRPTYTGGANNSGNSMVSQPVLQKTPGYSVDSDHDRVLSKKKLDELVRQVTGGGDSLGGGEALSPEVEEVCLCFIYVLFASFMMLTMLVMIAAHAPTRQR
jgi:transcription initiation factor TFIID subunit 12